MSIRWMRAALLAAALVGCGPTEDDEWSPQGDPQLAAGTWAVTLRHGAWARVLPTAAEATHGRLTLIPSPTDSVVDSRDWPVACRGCLRGTFRLDPTDWLPAPRSDSASAAVSADSTLLVMLSAGGPRCADCGNLLLHGRAKGRRITGWWEQEYLGRGTTGTFVLRRVAAR